MTIEMPVAAPARLRSVRELPGPPGLPLLGNALQIRTERLHLHLEEWARRYGDAFRVRLGAREFVAIANPDWIGAVLRDRPGGFQRTRRLTETASAFGFSGLFSANGEDWRRQRPMVLGGLDPSHIKTFFPTLVKVTGRFAARWQRAAAQGAAIDLQSDLMRYTVDVTAGLAFGTDINTIESREQVIQEHLDRVFPALFKRLFAPLPYWHWFKLPGDRRTEGHLTALRAAVDGFIAAAQRRLDADPGLCEAPANLIEAMLVARAREGSGITDADVAGNVLTMLLAGEDTTANTLAWTIWLLQQNPAALRRATEEARALLPAGGVPQGPQALRELDFVEACAHESMRLKPVAPLMAQQALRDSVVGDVIVPAGTLLLCLLRLPALDEAHFPRAAEYLPERWLEGAGPTALASSARRVNMPFGAGPRLCPGRYLALVEMKMVLAMLLANFDLLGVDTPDGGPAQERLTMTMWPVGLRLRLRERVAA
jgi:cytochrome P450